MPPRHLRRTRPGGALLGLALLATSPWAVLSPRSAHAQQAEYLEPSGGSERILRYDTHVEVAGDGSMTVVEDVLVFATGHDIQRGIYRDFPTRFPGELSGTQVVAPFEVVSVTRDGQPEPFELMTVRGADRRMGVRIRIGRADQLLEVPRSYLYTITYRTERWIVFGEGSDQLYWNATGNGWAFAIEQASAEVRLPAGVSPEDVRLESWTGPDGSTENRAVSAWDEVSGSWRFVTTTPLAAEEGLTVRVTFPEGVVQEPDRARRMEWALLDLRPLLATGAALLVVLGYYLAMWWRVGRDPPGRRLMVEYRPPDEMSPAAVRFLRRMGFDRKAFTATVVGLASKGRLRIDEKDGEYTLLREDEPDDAPALAREEERALLALFPGGSERLELDTANHTTVSAAITALRNSLLLDFEAQYFRTNRRWFLGGLAVTLGVSLWLAWTVRFEVPGEVWFLLLWLSFWSIGVVFLAVTVFVAWRSTLFGGGGAGTRLASGGGALFITLFALPFFAAEIGVSIYLFMVAPGYLLVAAALIGGLTVLFHHLLKAPTVRGRMAMDRIEGYRAFLSATEQDRMDRLVPPERTPELFQAYLPYAIALDVESEWAEQFEDVLTPVPEGEGAGTAWSPAWYHGSTSLTSLGSFASSLGGTFSSAISSASAAPSSGGGSSGGGGGGSSGGGGGGGGGGGW